MIKLLNISQEEIKSYSSEQIAGIILTLLKKFETGELNPSYYHGCLGSILSFEINPKWLGKNVKNGIFIDTGYTTVYGGDPISENLRELYNDAVSILRNEGLIRQDPTQSSSNFVKLTPKGRDMSVSSNFQLHIKRTRQFIIGNCRDSVLLMETYLGDEISCGTCFLIDDGVLITCRHNIEGRNFTIIFDENTRLDNTNFDVSLHENRDLAVIRFQSKLFMSLIKGKKPLKIGSSSELVLGDDLITIGFPKVAQRHTELLVSDGTFQNFTKDYYDDKYVTFTNPIHGGYSGGPVLSLYGEVVAVITESTEEVTGTDEQATIRGIHFHGTPIEEILILV